MTLVFGTALHSKIRNAQRKRHGLVICDTKYTRKMSEIGGARISSSKIRKDGGEDMTEGKANNVENGVVVLSSVVHRSPFLSIYWVVARHLRHDV